MEDYRTKIKSIEALKAELDHVRSQERRVVFTNGCFDLLHPGHVRYLWMARGLGDYLVVGLNSDRSVRSIKGSTRPVTDQGARSEVLAALGFVDAVVIFDEDTPLRLIEFILPDVLVKGGDWSEEKIVGGDVVKRNGGAVRVIPFVEGFSTTDIVKRIQDR